MEPTGKMSSDELVKFVSDGFDKAKAGKAIDVYNCILPYFDADLLPQKSHYAFGWIIYYALHQSDKKDILNRKQMLARYLKLSVTRPHKLHSMVLIEAIRLYRDSKEAKYLLRKNTKERDKTRNLFSLVRFAELWDLKNLREGDWRRKENDGKKMSSTVEKLITAYINELEECWQYPPEVFLQIFTEALNKFPDSATLLSQASIIYEKSNNREKAVDALKRAILLAPSKFYRWTRLAALIDREKYIKLYIALLHKALSCPGQDDMKGKVRLALAEAWISIDAKSQALFELDFIKNLYQNNGWHLSPRYFEAIKKISKEVTPVNPEPAYREIDYLADKFITSIIEEQTMAKSYHKEAGETIDRFGRKRKQPIAWRISDRNGQKYWFFPSRFGIDENLPMNTYLLVRILNCKVVSARVKIEENNF